MMKDLYSFHKDEKSLEDYYSKVEEAYHRIYNRCGVEAVEVEALSGSIGGEDSNEFMVLAEEGEDEVLICESCGYGRNVEVEKKQRNCPKCGGKLQQKAAIEAGHIFKLGDKYSKELEAFYTTKSGEQHPIIMGCYGIGVSRLMAAVAERRSDDKGLVWPQEIAPFDVHLLELNKQIDEEIKSEAEKVYARLQDKGFEVLFDERDTSAGEKFAEADLIGIPLRIVVSENTVSENKVEVKWRKDDEEKLVNLEEAIEMINAD
jgi:prolyl-tRNA synthetase